MLNHDQSGSILLCGRGSEGAEVGRELGHGAFAGADEGRGSDGEGVGFGDALALEKRGYEGGGEAVAGADGVGDFDFRGGLERDVAGGEDVAAVDSAGQNEHSEVVFAQQNPAFVLKVDAGIAEHATDGDKFFIVDFQDIAALHRVAEDFFGVESLTEVDVEDNEIVGGLRHSVEKAVYRVARNNVALGERAEAYGAGLPGERFEARGVGNIVPGHVLLYIILRDAGWVYLDLDCACGVGNFLDQMIETFRGEILDNLSAEGIVADGTDHSARQPELRYMIGKVCRRTADFLSFGQNVPQGFAHSYYNVVHDYPGKKVLNFFDFQRVIQEVDYSNRHHGDSSGLSDGIGSIAHGKGKYRSAEQPHYHQTRHFVALVGRVD